MRNVFIMALIIFITFT